MKIAILASTNGSNLPALFDAFREDKNVEFLLVVNKKNIGAIEKAKIYEIDCLIIESKHDMSKSSLENRVSYDERVLDILQKQNIDFVLMVGYMRILSHVFIDAFRERIYNIHPSLLPAFAGGVNEDVHRDVLDFGCKVSGATLHLASEVVDDGRIIDQRACVIVDGETVLSLKNKVQKLEQEMLIDLLQNLKFNNL
jgi:formyltetrahydrofolate-dependent phosphoribosylglycinamide formyltransferase